MTDTIPTSMRSKFAGYFRDSDEVISAAWDNHIFVFDTNILMHFYRYSEPTRSDLEKVMSKLKNRAWIPHRVAREFFNNRWSTIEIESKRYDSSIKVITDLIADLEKTRQHPFVTTETLEESKLCFDKLKDDLLKNKELLLKNLHNDTIADFFDDLFTDNIGAELTLAEEEEIISQGKIRYEEKQPPGYLDSKKANDDAPHEAKLRCYGDLIIWLEIIKKAKEESKGIILIIDDRKDDWWMNIVGQTLGPRPELIDEFKRKTNQTIYLYTPDRFVEFSSQKFQQQLNPETVNEVRDIQQQPDEPPSENATEQLADDWNTKRIRRTHINWYSHLMKQTDEKKSMLHRELSNLLAVQEGKLEYVSEQIQKMRKDFVQYEDPELAPKIEENYKQLLITRMVVKERISEINTKLAKLLDSSE